VLEEVYALSNIHIPHANGIFKESVKAVKPLVLEDCNIHVGIVDQVTG
jgi:hypothetical protein